MYRKVVYDTSAFVTRELTSPEGAFYSALDADSEGVEGKFYIWSHKELITLLGNDEPLFRVYYSIEAHGNWEHGANILYKTKTDAELESLTGKKIADIEATIRHCNSILLAERTRRIRPGLDDKIITSWNALMIKGFADAYSVFGDTQFLYKATTCADFLINTLLVHHQLYRIYKNGKVSIPGFADDYALLCEALMRVYEVSGNEHYLRIASSLLESAIAHFYNEETALFYFTSNEGAQLITRKTDMQDDVIPSANSTFAKCLYKLGFYMDKPEYHVMAKKMVKAVQSKFAVYTSSYSNWMQVLGWMEHGFYQVIITGKNTHETYRQCVAAYVPNAIIIQLNAPSTLPLLADKTIGDEIAIYVCTDHTCSLPVTTAAAALQQVL
jgi:uncharacterized protein